MSAVGHRVAIRNNYSVHKTLKPVIFTTQMYLSKYLYPRHCSTSCSAVIYLLFIVYLLKPVCIFVYDDKKKKKSVIFRWINVLRSLRWFRKLATISITRSHLLYFENYLSVSKLLHTLNCLPNDSYSASGCSVSSSHEPSTLQSTISRYSQWIVFRKKVAIYRSVVNSSNSTR